MLCCGFMVLSMTTAPLLPGYVTSNTVCIDLIWNVRCKSILQRHYISMTYIALNLKACYYARPLELWWRSEQITYYQCMFQTQGPSSAVDYIVLTEVYTHTRPHTHTYTHTHTQTHVHKCIHACRQTPSASANRPNALTPLSGRMSDLLKSCSLVNFAHNQSCVYI